MASERLKLVLEVSSALAVVASVVFLAFQVNQANDIARASMRYDLESSWNEWHDLIISDSTTAALLVRMQDADAVFSPTEQQQVFSLANRLYNIWSSLHAAHENGLISDEDYTSLSEDVPSAMVLEAAVPIWRQLVERYPADRDAPIFTPLFEDE